MTTATVVIPLDLEARARHSLGVSHAVIYDMVGGAIERHGGANGRLLDVGCGRGDLRHAVSHLVTSYAGIDAVRYESWPVDCEFRLADLDTDDALVGEGAADVVVAVETVEHLQNPWAFFRHLSALVAPGGLVIVTTPNQLSLLSLLTLVVRRRHSAFQDAQYPAHLTALLESDLYRCARAARLDVVETRYSAWGRMPFVPWHYPKWLAGAWPRRLSDNVMLVARKPHV